MNRYLFVALLSVVCGACSFSASCGKKSVKADELEADLKARVVTLGLTPASVDCPDGVEPKVGGAFVCKIGFGGDDVHELEVTISTVDEKTERVMFDTRWVKGSAVVATKLAELLTTRFTETAGPGLVFDCGKSLRYIGVDKTITCDVTAGAYHGTIGVLYDDAAQIKAADFTDPMLAKKTLEDLLTPSVREQTGPDIVVTCGDQSLLLRPADGAIWCDITDGKQRAKIRVEVDEQLNIQKWAVTGPPPAP